MFSGPCHVCLVGSSAAGKTVFLGGLMAASDPNRKSTVAARPAGATYDRLRELAAALRDGHWPPSTDGVTVFTLPVHVGDRGLSLTVLDYAGELMRELAALRVDKLREVYEQIRRADVLVLLLDPADLSDGSQAAVDKLVALVTAVEAAWAARPEGKAARKLAPKDVALVLTKADLHPELKDGPAAAAYVARHGANLLARLTRHAQTVKVFALSATGPVTRSSDGRTAPGPDLDPRGYDELFGWIVERRVRRTTLKKAGLLAAAAAILLAFSLGYFAFEYRRQAGARAAIADSTLAVSERVRIGRLSDDTAVRQKVGELADGELVRLGSVVDAAVSEKDLAGAADDLKTLRDGLPADKVPAADDLLRKAERRRVDFAYTTAKDGGADGRERFLKDFPGDPRAEEIRGTKMSERAKEVRDARLRVKGLGVGNRDDLVRKRDAALDFLKSYEKDIGPAEAKEIASAIATAGTLLGNTSYTLSLSSSGQFARARWHRVDIRVAGTAILPTAVAAKDAMTATYPPFTFTFTWTAGTNLQVDLSAERSFGTIQLAASNSFAAPDAILELRGAVPLLIVEAWQGYFSTEGAFATFATPGLFSDTSVAEYKKYINPGTGW